MRFLLHSNGPTVKTGYGVQAAQLSRRLLRAGHEVAVSCTYGQQGSVGTWTPPEGSVTLYPCGYETNGNDVIHAHALHYFEGDPLGGWIVPILDVWCLMNPRLAEFNVAAWAPVDHFPVPPDVLKFFHRTGATPIAMSRFGERLFFEAGLDPVYIPLAVDTTAYKPTPTVTVADKGEVDARTLFNLPHDAFVVGMVGMNKGWARDRKGFNEALRAFGQFWQRHQHAVLFMHAEQWGGAEGINLVELARHAAVPEHAIVWTDQYAYRLGLPADMMAAAYTAMDVLLAPSHGEGFCVPLVEAQACGTPVIATDFSAQTELVGAGWLVTGQPEWDPAQHASYVCPFIHDIVEKLEEAYAADLPAMQEKAISFASDYDADAVFDGYWRPFLATLEPPAAVADKPMMERCDVLVPMMREENEQRLVASFFRTAPDTATLDSGSPDCTYAENVNDLLKKSTADWVLVVGDDVEFTPGWFEAAQKLSDRFDVIGTNDSEPGRIRNPEVASGRHADHFFVRRSYIDGEGACLDGPGVLAPECYRHWYPDKEIIGLAKARGVFAPCLDSVIIHHHPGYDGREDLRRTDPVYMKAVDSEAADRKMFMERVPLIEMQRVHRGKVA
jgi:glycosyltransferase involved in cell wall biosynthesis